LTHNFQYFNNNRQTKSAEVTYDPETRKKLWDLSENLIGIPSGNEAV